MTNKIHITTLGCPKNSVDSGHLEKAFLSQGFTVAEAPEDADILLVNTCGFIKDAKEESIEEILGLAKMKARTRKKLLVFGCLAARYRDELLKEIPEVDALWGVGEDEKIIEYCKTHAGNAGNARKATAVVPFRALPHSSPLAQSYAYLKIAEGCDKKCTFCVIPSIRGKFRSNPAEGILEEAKEYIRQGTRELILVAQDITNYGKESADYNLVSLLKDLAALDGDFRIRLLYLYPTAVSDELIDYMAAEPKIQKYLDIPLQHSEDRILRLMGRRGTRKEYTKLLRTIRRKIPQVALRTTFIVGFPGETEEDFNGLVDFIEEMRFDRLGVFKFSKEEGTPSAKLKGQVPEKVKDRRLDELMKRQALISLEKNSELIGKRYEAIIDESDGEVVIARLYSHAPEIDGAVIIETSPPHPPLVKGGNSLSKPLLAKGGSRGGESLKAGDLVEVEITDVYDYDVKAKLIKGGRR